MQTPDQDYSKISPQFQRSSAFIVVCVSCLNSSTFISLMAPAMSVALRTICYAGSRDQVGACHSQEHSVTVVGCLSPCDTTVRRKQHDTHHGRLLHRVNVHRSLLECCSDLLRNYTDSPSRWPERRYSPQRFDSAVSHAAAAHARAEITEMNVAIDSHSRHERDPTDSDEVITADTAWRLEAGSGKTDESTTCSSERPQVRMCKPPCPQRWTQRTGSW